MLNCNDLSVDNKEVKYMTIDGKIVYSTDPDNSYSLYGLEDVTLSSVTKIYPAGSYTPPGVSNLYTYGIYRVPAENFWGGGSGSDHLFPISQHVFARAAHWGNELTSTSVGNAIVGDATTYNCTVSEVANLTTWAKNNGFDADFVDSLHVDDIQMVYTQAMVLTAGIYTEEDIPYVIPEIQFQGMFHRDVLSGLVGYCGTQLMGEYTGVAQPIVFGTEIGGEVAWSTPQRNKALLPVEEYTTYMRSSDMAPTYLGTTGDSGKPVYMTIAGGKKILVSHNHQIYKPGFGATVPYVMTGPNYFKAYPLIKAYVESKGDTLKVL